MGRAVSYTFNAIDKFTPVMGRISRSLDKVKTNIAHVNERMRDAKTRFSDATDAMQGVALKATAASAALLGFGAAAVAAAGRNQALTTSFQVMTGSVETGTQLVKDLYQFAKTTPFEIGELGDAAKMLLAMDTPANELISTMQTLGDMAAATGRSVSEFALVWGQIDQNEFLTGGDAMQLTTKGIGIKGLLAKDIGKELGREVSVAEVIDLISKRQISAARVQKVLTQLTSEGGLFFKMMDKTSMTMPGVWSNFKDGLGQSMIAIGDVIIQQFDLIGTFTWLNSKITEFVGWIKKFTAENPKLTKFMLVFVAIAAIVGPLLLTIIAMAGAVAMFGAALGVTAAGAAILAAVFAGFVTISAAVYTYWEQIKAVIVYIGDLIKAIFNPLDTLKSLGQAIGTDSILGSALNLVGDIGNSTTNTSEVNVNLNAPKGTIKSVRSESRGPGLKLGVAMGGQ